MYNVVATGSNGNCIIYHNTIMVDCGLPYFKISNFVQKVQIILLTHEHLDHINIKTLERLSFERPSLRFGCCEWMFEKTKHFRNVDIYEVGKLYNYGSFSVSPVKLYHDVPNCGYRIFKDNTAIFHATDTAHLNGIEARNYDLYAIEHNYDEDVIYDIIAAKEAKNEFAYQKGAINSHLSEQKAKEFIYKNKGDHSKVLRLHESSII